MTDALMSSRPEQGQDEEPPAPAAGPGDDVELALLEVRGLIESTVLKHRHRIAQDALITAVGAEREEDVKASCLRLVDDATETVDAVLADAEYAEAVRAVYAKLATEKPELRIRLLCTQGVLDLGLVHPDVLERPCVEVRVARVSMLQAMIVDSRAALVTAPSAAGRQASVIRSATVIRTLGPLFDSLWQHAVAVTDRIDLEDRNWAKAPARILECLQAGVTDETAARELSVSVRTYRRYVAEIMTLLGASSRFQAGVRAAELNLLPGTGSRSRPPADPAPGRSAAAGPPPGASAGRRQTAANGPARARDSGAAKGAHPPLAAS